LATVDVSFISLALVLPVLGPLGIPEIIALVKPQFEVGKGLVGKRGVVRAATDHLAVLERVATAAAQAGYVTAGVTYSPLRGPEGNIEFLLYLCRGESAEELDKAKLGSVVAAAHEEFLLKATLPLHGE